MWKCVAALCIAVLCSCGSPEGAGSGRARAPAPGGVLNRFPADYGPVPQGRGTDQRPAAAALGVNAVPVGTRTLVLYDSTGPWGWLGELYAIAAGQLASHFGSWQALPVSLYQSCDLCQVDLVIYVGSTYDEPLPVAFLDDVLRSTKPVIWAYDNIWQLAARSPAFGATYGFDPWYFDGSAVSQVRYRGQLLTRRAENGGGIMSYSFVDPQRAQVLAEAVRADGTSFPWAVRSLAGNLTYLGEIPFAYIDETDRYLAFADLLFDALAPATAERHRALVRIEDVSAYSDPAHLRAIADALFARSVPFSVAVIPRFRDPLNADGGGAADVGLAAAPTFVAALRHMQARGGTLVMHGFTHQLGTAVNPYSAMSADDLEFYTAHVDAADYVVLDGPVPGDSAVWAQGRIAAAALEFLSAGLAPPGIFEYPHYAGSAVDSRAISALIPSAYHRGLYFGGALAGTGGGATSHVLGQFFPYTVNDVYGFRLIPENCANYEPVAYNHNPPRLVADIVRNAQANLVVRDGVASFYFHPYEDPAKLLEIVGGIQAAGYVFVAPGAL